MVSGLDVKVEIEYWKNRAAKLTLLVEQINSHPCKMTLVTLRAANCKLLKVVRFLALIPDESSLLQIWHDIDMKIAHYHVEACDNAKYLGATEQYSHRIYLEVTRRKRPVHVSSWCRPRTR